jgi:hypothetical protein
MATEWTKRDVVRLLDFYVKNLRILARRFANSVLPEDLCLPADWHMENGDEHCLYDVELAGIKASGYPEVFQRPGSAAYATPQTFLEFLADSFKNSAEGTFLAHQWRLVPVGTIELDPRYVAFRTAHDWVVLHAQILADDPSGSDVLDLSERDDPFWTGLPRDDPDEPAGLVAGNPLTLADGGFRNRFNPNFVEPWGEVSDHIDAIHYFHFRGTFLLHELDDWPYESAEGHDARLVRLELLNPKGFADYVATRIVKDRDAIAFHTWHNRPLEDVERDPRFIAHKCAFDRDMILRMAQPTETVVES